MTPKEKADNICVKMLYEMEWNGNVPLLKKNAKQCALIAVDEILRVLWNTHKNETYLLYYLEVKQEIEKL